MLVKTALCVYDICLTFFAKLPEDASIKDAVYVRAVQSIPTD